MAGGEGVATLQRALAGQISEAFGKQVAERRGAARRDGQGKAAAGRFLCIPRTGIPGESSLGY